jgi:hypothetical protein
MILQTEYTIRRELTPDDFDVILTTAIEGGISYWACLDNSTDDWKAAKAELIEELKDEENEYDRKPTYDQIMMRLLQNGKSVAFTDAEDPDNDEVWELTAEKLMTGALEFQAERMMRTCDVYDIKSEIENGDFDADDADAVMQYALFGDVIYG